MLFAVAYLFVKCLLGLLPVTTRATIKSPKVQKPSFRWEDRIATFYPSPPPLPAQLTLGSILR